MKASLLFLVIFVSPFFVCLALIAIVPPLLILTFRCAWLVKGEHDTSSSPSELINSLFCSPRHSHLVRFHPPLILLSDPVSLAGIPVSPSCFNSVTLDSCSRSLCESESELGSERVSEERRRKHSHSCLHLRCCISVCALLLPHLFPSICIPALSLSLSIYIALYASVLGFNLIFLLTYPCHLSPHRVFEFNSNTQIFDWYENKSVLPEQANVPCWWYIK